MPIQAKEVKRLIESLATQTNQPLDYSGFGIMSFILEDANEKNISQRYLYENAWRGSQKAILNDQEYIRLSLFKLDQIARFLGHARFYDFQGNLDDGLPMSLQGCIGEWESYSRNNSGKNQILISPLHIYVQQGKVYMKLIGPQRDLEGTVDLHSNCLCSLLTSEDKSLYLILKVGLSRNPKVIQGVFSGTSTAGEPIAGREVLIRVPENSTHKPTNRIIHLDNKKSCADVPKAILTYFQYFEENYVKIKRPSSFTLEDLED